MTQQTFLVEIGTEELPPKALRSLAESFAANFTAELDSADITHGAVNWFAAPRRLALKVESLAAAQPDREVENVVQRFRKRLMRKVNQQKQLKVGHVVAVLQSTKRNA